MKILYYTCRDMTETSSGINKKIFSQAKALEKLGCEVDLVYRINDCEMMLKNSEGEKIIASKLKRPYKIAASKAVREFIKGKIYAGVYIRYPYMDNQFYILLKELKKKNTKIIVEIPTYPYDEELKDGLENRIVLFLDKMYRESMHLFVDRIVIFSRENNIYNIPTIKTSNGVDYDTIRMRCPKDNGNEIHLIAVAEVAKWHGYERLYKGLGEYYKNGGDRKVVMHLVGDGPMMKEYKQIVQEYGIEEYCIFHGRKHGEELDEIYDTCNIGIEVLAAFRKNIKVSSSLKSREYMAKGLPFVLAGELDLFNEKNFICKVPSDETNIKIVDIIDFYDRTYENRTYLDVAEEIRKLSEKHCSMQSVMMPIVKFFEIKG